MGEYRWTIDELEARYKFEPGIRDIYVKGSSDKKLLQWFIKRMNLARVKVYPIDRVEVGPAVAGKEGGNRERVVALAQELDRRLAGASEGVRCIADRDFDILLNVTENINILWWTDYSCLETYFLEEKYIVKLFEVFVGRELENNFYISMINVLERSFLLRAAIRECRLYCGVVQIKKYILFKSGNLVFNENEYIDNTLTSGGAADKIVLIRECIGRLSRMLTPDPRNQIHGHDLIEMLALYARSRQGGSNKCTPEIIESALMTVVELDDLRAHPLFVRLVQWGEMPHR